MSLLQFWEQFETSSPPREWFVTGGAGFDWDKGLAYKGKGNAWVRFAAEGTWNAVNRWVPLEAAPVGALCTASAWLRISPDVTDGYMSVRSGVPDGSPPGPVINEVKLIGPTPPDNNGYKQFTFNFARPQTSNILFYVGLVGNGRDGWIQIDEVIVQAVY